MAIEKPSQVHVQPPTTVLPPPAVLAKPVPVRVPQKPDQFFGYSPQELFKKIAVTGTEFLGGAALTGVVSILCPEVLALRGLGLVVDSFLGVVGGNLGHQFGGALFAVPAEDPAVEEASIGMQTLGATFAGIVGSLVCGTLLFKEVNELIESKPAWKTMADLRNKFAEECNISITSFEQLEAQTALNIRKVFHTIVETETHRLYIHPSGLMFGVKNDFSEVSPVFGGLFHSSNSNRFWIESSGPSKSFNSLAEAIQDGIQSRSFNIKYSEDTLKNVPNVFTYLTGINPSIYETGFVPFIKVPRNSLMGVEEYAQDFGCVQRVVKSGQEHNLQKEWMNWGVDEADDFYDL